MSPLIRLKNIEFSFQPDQPILHGVNLEVDAGEFLGIIGPNGGGKSTLVKVILGLLEPQAGEIEVLGTTPREAAKQIGYVPQFASFPKDFPISVLETILMGRLGITKWWGGYRQNDKDRAYEIMNLLELQDLAHQSIGSLSGGQLQRVLLARALIINPELLILDEPTASVDPHGEKDIFDLLFEHNKEATILLVSHDIGFVSQRIQRVACVNRTLVCHQTSEVTGESIQNLYGEHIHVIDHCHDHKDHLDDKTSTGGLLTNGRES